LSGTEGQARLALITGDIEVGKTTTVGRIIELAQVWGYTCAGIWSPAREENGIKTGIEAVDLASGERRLLAQIATKSAGQHMGRYAFDPAVLAWANEVLVKAVAARPDLLVVDEIGPLELERGGGLAPVLEPLAAGRVPRVLVVVRAWLLDALRTRLSDVPAKAFTVNGATRDQVPQQVTDWLFETSTPPA
jgi:nucleoside-triphosphatase THEP1